jgi:O6-methylguanine-DNA--protein-cysteine methyltransferase
MRPQDTGSQGARMATGGVDPSLGSPGAVEALLKEGPPMPAGLAVRILERVGIPPHVYDRYAVADSPAGPLRVAFGRGALTGSALVASFARPADFEAAHRVLTGRSALPAVQPPPGVAAALRGGRGRGLRFDFGPLPDAAGEILRALPAIPRGQLRPVGWLCREIGRPDAQGEVLAVVRDNPFPVLLPAHRLTLGDGTPVACGLPVEAARALRVHEGVDEAGVKRLALAGGLYLGSDTTRIFCYPTCAHARRITERHRVPFPSPDAARAVGYRACLVCRPVDA